MQPLFRLAGKSVEELPQLELAASAKLSPQDPDNVCELEHMVADGDGLILLPVTLLQVDDSGIASCCWRVRRL